MNGGLWEGWSRAWPYIFGSNNPAARDIGSDGNCYKKGLGSSTGTLPLSVYFHTHWVSRGRG